MAFVAEDGSGLPNSNAYVTVAFVDGHHLDRGNSKWEDLAIEEKQFSIIRATDYIDKRFGRRFRGERQSKDQALEWPRLSAFDNDGFLLGGVDDIPRALQKATAEYALRAAINGVLAPDPALPSPAQSFETGAADQDASTVITGEVSRTREVVGPVEEEKWYETRSQVIGKNLAAGAKGIQSGLINDFVIPEYPEADLWIEEILESSMVTQLARA